MQRKVLDDLSCVDGADWRRVGGRSSSLGGRRCSDGRGVSSGQRTGLIWQQQRGNSCREGKNGRLDFQDDPLNDVYISKYFTRKNRM